jgi:Rrf2 family protein
MPRPRHRAHDTMRLVLRLSKLCDYAILLMSTIARESRAWSTTELAELTDLPTTTAAKILKALARGGVLESQRGKLGGYILTRDPNDVSLLEIIEVIDGPIALSESVANRSEPEHKKGHRSVTGVHLRRLNDGFRESLAEMTLARVARPAPRAAAQRRRFH